MSDEAKKKVATAAKQAKHAVSNVEDAAEMQAEEALQIVVETTRPLMPIAQSAALVAGGAVAYHFVSKAVVKVKARRAAKKLEQEPVIVERPVE